MEHKQMQDYLDDKNCITIEQKMEKLFDEQRTFEFPKADTSQCVNAVSESNEGIIRIGKDHQATLPVCVPLEQQQLHQSLETELLVWSPNPLISEEKLDKYIKLSKEKYGYNEEQALEVLFRNKHDIDNAIPGHLRKRQFCCCFF